MGQDQRRIGRYRIDTHAVQVRGVWDVARHRPDRSGTEAAQDNRDVTTHLMAKASRALAIRAAKARWSVRKKNSDA
jgi:hypothetical protein